MSGQKLNKIVLIYETGYVDIACEQTVHFREVARSRARATASLLVRAFSRGLLHSRTWLESFLAGQCRKREQSALSGGKTW